MVSQIAVKNQTTGWFHVTRSNKLDSQRIYDFGYRSAASFWCRKYSGRHSATFKWFCILTFHYIHEQGKSEGFESCDQPTVRKCPIWVKIGDVLYRVTLKFDGWHWKTIGHLSFAVSSFVQHFIAIGEFKLELQSGNTQFGSNLMIFRAVWPWNLTDDLQKQ